MCTSIVANKGKTIVGWNLDLLDMEYRVRPEKDAVYIEVNDAAEGWMPLFGANARGDFVGMPTCWPYDDRSDPKPGSQNVIMLDVDLLLGKKTLREIRDIAENEEVCSVPGLTFMPALSDREGNVLHIIPGQGSMYYEKPEYKILTNFSPFKQYSETHPWMGRDRYQKADAMLREAGDSFDAGDCMEVLKAVSQEECPTVVSMVYDVDERTVYWCENRKWDDLKKAVIGMERDKASEAGGIIPEIVSRRSVRNYTDREVTDEQIALLIKAAGLAPSGKNSQPWDFIAVRSREMREKICAADHGQEWMLTAPVFIVCIGDTRYRADGNTNAVIRDSAIATEHILLQAEHMGLGTCWTGWYEQDEMRCVLGLDEHCYVIGIVTLGYSAEEPEARPRREIEYKVL